MKEVTVADLLDEYGASLRGSWGDIDGRSEQSSLWELSDAIRNFGNSALPEHEVASLRYGIDVCPKGKGHWTEYCDEDCEEG